MNGCAGMWKIEKPLDKKSLSLLTTPPLNAWLAQKRAHFWSFNFDPYFVLNTELYNWTLCMVFLCANFCHPSLSNPVKIFCPIKSTPGARSHYPKDSRHWDVLAAPQNHVGCNLREMKSVRFIELGWNDGIKAITGALALIVEWQI